jgi:hypothetical protein
MINLTNTVLIIALVGVERKHTIETHLCILAVVDRDRRTSLLRVQQLVLIEQAC